MIINLRVWRQANAQSRGKMVSYRVENVSEDMSFLEMLDLLNEDLTSRARSRSRSTTTAARASAACVAS